MKKVLSYLKCDDAATLTVETVLMVSLIVVIAGVVSYFAINYFTSSADSASCSHSNEVFCIE